MKSWQHILFGLLMGLIVAAFFLLTLRGPSGQPIELLLPPTPQPIVIHVAGAVQNPGVYHLPSGSRVLQAVNAAGGFANEANQDGVNLAAPLHDGMKLEIPVYGEEVTIEIPLPPSESSVKAVGVEPVNINTATEDELMNLPNIGPTRAKAIIQYREDHGAFSSVDELINVTGIGLETFESIKDMVIVR